jgi:hypothetical protein
MPETTYRNRRAFEISNERLIVTLLAEGGHIARIADRRTGVNPLWTPPWPSIEPSTYHAARHPEYGAGAEAKLLAGIMGHNLCMDIFGGPSEEEAAAGMTVHGEAAVASYGIDGAADRLTMRARFAEAQLAFERSIALDGDVVRIRETVENETALDRPIAWTQHVSMGPPFVEGGVTQFRTPATRSKVIESDFSGGRGFQKTGAEFDWPHCPRRGEGTMDLRVYPSDPVSAGYTAHRMDPAREHAFFAAYHPRWRLLFGYVWNRRDFPWLGRWEENRLRRHAPWNGETVTCGMEFGVSPMPETRRAMIERGTLFGEAGYRWIPARSAVTVEYCAFAREASAVAESVEWDGAGRVAPVLTGGAERSDTIRS